MPFAAQGDPSPDLIRKKSELSIRRQCELLGVTRSRIYHTPKPPNEEAVERKERIMALIDYWHTENPAWGARKIRVLLRNDGYYVSRKTVHKNMIFALLPGRDGVAGSDPTSDNLPRTLFLCETDLPTDHPFDGQRLQSLRRVHRAGHWLALCKNPRLSHRGYDIFTTVMRILS